MLASTVRLLVAAALVLGVSGPLVADPAAKDFDPAVARRIKPDEVQKRRDAGEKPVIIDTRGVPADVVARGSVHVPGDRLESWAKDVPKNAFIVAYCT